MLTFLSRLSKLLENILVSLSSLLIDANHLTSVTRSQNLGGEKGKTVLSWNWPSCPTLQGGIWVLEGMVVSSQLQTQRNAPTAGAKECHALFPTLTRESLTCVYQLTDPCSRFVEKKSVVVTAQVVIRGCGASSREQSTDCRTYCRRRWPATHPVLLWWPQTTETLGQVAHATTIAPVKHCSLHQGLAFLCMDALSSSPLRPSAWFHALLDQ